MTTFPHSPSARRLRRLLSLLMLPALALAILPPATPVVRAQTTPSPCPEAGQVERWRVSFSLQHSDAQSWERLQNYTTYAYTASANMAFSGAGVSTRRAQQGSGVVEYGVPLTGTISGARTRTEVQTTRPPGLPPYGGDVSRPEDQVSGSGAAGSALSLYIDPATCSATFQASADGLPGVFTDALGRPASHGFSVSVRRRPIVRAGGEFTIEGSATALLPSGSSFPPGTDTSAVILFGVAYALRDYYIFVGDPIAARAPVTWSISSEGGGPPAAISLDGVSFQRQDRESAAWRDLPQSANVPDGSPARVVARLRNSGSEPATAQIRFRNSTSGQQLPGCPSEVSVPPTGDGAPHSVVCVWDTAGMAWFDDDPASPGSRHTIEVELTPAGGAAQRSAAALTVRPRPVIFVPGIGGNYARGDDTYWLLNRGVPPDALEIDPLIRSYDGILKTLENTGYMAGRDLFLANYDWRIVPGPSDRVYDGVVTGLSPEGISDGTYSYGVDYFGEAARAADSFWRASFDSPLDYVDVIAHSTGGLVTRTYIQSTAYGGVYDQASGASLPEVRNFISVGVPHRGASKAWNPLHDNWGIDPSFQAVLSKIANHAFQKLAAGATIAGPDGAITRVEMTDPRTGRLVPEWFIKRYVPTINTLLATYPFIDRGDNALDDANDGNFANHLLLDLNNGADITPGRDPNLFLARTRLTAIGATSERTPTYVDQRFGPADDVLAPFSDFFKNDAAEGELFFSEVFVENGGDGTVPTLSSVGQFQGDPRARVLTYQRGINTLEDVAHTALTDNPQIQSDILRTLGAPVRPENLAALGREDLDQIGSVILDPVQGYVVDAEGRRLGWTEASGPLSEIPNSFWRGGADGFGLIFGPVSGTLRLELRGMDGPYYAQVTRVTPDGRSGGVTLRGPRLARDEAVGAPALVPGEIYLPLLSAGGPYTVAEGGSVPVSATGEPGLAFSWDLDGDGAFETAGESASFSAAAIDGPASRDLTARGVMPTGQSATASAQVTVTNAAPTATLSAPASATAGQPFTLSLSGASDPGADPLQFAFDCGQGFGPRGARSSATCTPAAAGSLTVRALVADDDGGETTYTATLSVVAAPPAGRPSIPLCYADGAQTVQEYQPGRRNNGSAVPPPRRQAELALGLPQRDYSLNFVSLGLGGSLTLRFANPLVNDDTGAPDIRVWETTPGERGRSWGRNPEAVELYASIDGQSWTLIGTTTDKDQAYDLALPRARFLRLVDVSDPARFGPSEDGFDLDAVEALSGCVSP